MNSWQKYFFVGMLSARSNLAYFADVVGRVLFLGVILYIFLRLWQVTFSETGASQLGGLTLAQMLWYLAITEAITLSGPRIAQAVDEDVRTGVLAVQMTKPINYALYRLSTTLGERLVRFLMNLAVAAAVALLFVGPLNFSFVGLLFFFLAIPFAFVLDFLGSFLVGLGAFWLEDTSGIHLVYSRMTMILGGMLIPLQLFPKTWQPIIKILPFSSILYGPAHMFVSPNLNELGHLLARQSLAILVFAILVAFVYHKAQQRIFSNGG